VAGDLAILLASPVTTSVPLPNFNPTYRVAITFQRFESVEAHETISEAVWVVHHNVSGHTRTGSTLVSEPAQGDGFDALAAAHSRALARLSSDIAAAIQEDSSDGKGRTKKASPPASAGHVSPRRGAS